MESKALVLPIHGQNARSVQLVLVRANGPLFYSVAAAALLEAGAVEHARRLAQTLAADHALLKWVECEWLPRKLARAGELQAYVESTWPEFDWAAAQEDHRSATACGALEVRPTVAHEALARCVAAAQSAVFYRCLARWAEDARLREMARRYAQEEALAFIQLRAIYEVCARGRHPGFAAAWRTAFACVRSARDTYAARAFRALQGQCRPNVPFNVLGYEEFVARMRSVVERHGELGAVERILLSSWKAQPRVTRTDARRAAPAWFKPLFKAA